MRRVVLSERVRRAARFAPAVTLVLLAGCTGAQDYVDRYAHPAPSRAEFSVCHGYGCRLRTFIRIEPEGWADVAAAFRPPPASGAEERARIARAIALFEVKVGAAVGTSTDIGAATTFGGEPDQLDCIDETVNTTVYLRLLANEGLMRLHAVGTAAQRGSLMGFQYNDFITNTAVIVETATGAAYAVDSYFYPNGREPKILPLADWKRNWRPAPGDPLLAPLTPPPSTSAWLPRPVRRPCWSSPDCG